MKMCHWRPAERTGVVFSSLVLFIGATAPMWGAPKAASAYGPITVPLRALSTNPHYFTDGGGRAIYLTGSQTWNTFQDWGTHGSVQPIDFTAFVNMLRAHNHNFTLIWATELPTFHGLPTTAVSPPDFTVSPLPWERMGPGIATDGKLKFDLTKFNQNYFDRLRDRVALNGHSLLVPSNRLRFFGERCNHAREGAHLCREFGGRFVVL